MHTPRLAKFRQVKVKLPTGKWIQFGFREQKVKKYLLPRHHVYYSVSAFVSPSRVYGYKSVPIILASDMVIDIDADQTKDVHRTVEETVEVLKSMGYKDLKIVYTGGRGFHIYVNDFRFDLSPDPYARLKSIISQRKSFSSLLSSHDLPLDYSVIEDPFRVVRLPGSYHGDTGELCRFVSLDEIYSCPIHPKKKKKKLLSLTLSISSKVPGTKDRHVVLLDYDTRFQDVYVDIFRLAHTYKIYNYAVFPTVHGAHVMFLEALPYKRVAKIMASARHDQSLTSMFLHTGRAYIPS